jgi:UDP-N-acetylmuramate dehydrogenase
MIVIKKNQDFIALMDPFLNSCVGLGRIEEYVVLSKMTWLRVGGPARYVFHPNNAQDLSQFLQHVPEKERFVLGAGSNILARDGGVSGVVIKIGKGFRQFRITSDYIDLGAGLLDRYVAQQCQILGFSGLEFMATIPGTIGGGLAMNASCYGGSFADRLIHACVMDPEGKKHTLSVHELGYGYRSCGLPPGWTFLSGRFRYTKSDPVVIAGTMNEMAEMRDKTQPTKVKTGGSTFANPEQGPAWYFLDKAGFRGKTLGQAMFSEKHCNFLINLGDCTAGDLENLAEAGKKAVYEQCGVTLQWEIVRWGRPLAPVAPNI